MRVSGLVSRRVLGVTPWSTERQPCSLALIDRLSQAEGTNCHAGGRDDPRATDDRGYRGEGSPHVVDRRAGVLGRTERKQTGDGCRVHRHERGKPNEEVGPWIETGALEGVEVHLSESLENRRIALGEDTKVMARPMRMIDQTG
jgi:hypothetical protein